MGHDRQPCPFLLRSNAHLTFFLQRWRFQENDVINYGAFGDLKTDEKSLVRQKQQNGMVLGRLADLSMISIESVSCYVAGVELTTTAHERRHAITSSLAEFSTCGNDKATQRNSPLLSDTRTGPWKDHPAA